MNNSGVSPILVAGTAVGFIGLLASGMVSGWERFWVNWIIWFLFLLTIGLGCLFIVALEHVVGTKWSVPLRRVPEKLSVLIPGMGPVAVIALMALPVLYPWTRPEVLEDPIVGGKAIWLNVPFFSIRVVICFVFWLLAYRIFVSGSLRQDTEKNPQFNVRARRFAPVFMILFGLTLTIVAFDWISSLEPTWYSDIFGVYLFAGTFLAGLAGTVLAINHLVNHNRLPGIEPDHLYNLGGFLFAFVVFWSYIGFAQYMLIWYANLPEEVFWYQERLQGLWLPIVLALAVFHFLVPFFILVPREIKGNPRRLATVAAVLLIAHWLDLYWMIFPVLGKGPLFGWPELSFAVFFVCAALLWIRRRMSFGADMPVGDPFLREGLEFRL